MEKQKRKLLAYSQEDMEAALRDCDRGLPVATAAKKYKVPRITLLYKFRGKIPRKCTMGLKSYLSNEEEKILSEWIIQAARAGFPVGKDQLLDSVKQLMIELKRENPFHNNRPGKSWYKLFLKRNPDISARTPQNLTTSRASVTQEKIKGWFNEVQQYLESQHQQHILKNPERVFNADEAAFFLNPKGDKVLAKRGEKNVYQVVNADEKECLTVLLTANAAGHVAPPMVIFKYERIPKEIAASVPGHWGLGKSETGWMTRETFFEFVTNVFYPWLVDNKFELPIILFIDGHVSHLTLHLSRFCEEKGIILVALYPNATHLIQPMDVAVFRTVKAGWKENIHQFRLQRIENPTIRKSDFSPLLAKTLEERLDISVLRNGFRKCGLVPWNPEEVCVPIHNQSISIKENKDSQQKVLELQKGKLFLEKYIEPEKIQQFNTHTDMWTGPAEDLSLYNLYMKILRDIKKIQQEETNIISESENNPVPSTSSNKTPIKILSDTIIIPASTPSDDNTPTPVLQSIENKTPIEQNNVIIPSPFKRALTWPEPKPVKHTKRLREKIPSVVTSKQWQLYYEGKENKKRTDELQRQIKAEERQKKKANQEKLKQEKKLTKQSKKNIRKRQNHSSDSESSEEWKPSGSSEDEISSLGSTNENQNIINTTGSNFRENDYIIAKFPGKKREHKYVCVIQELLPNDEAEVVGLKKCEDERSFKLNESDVSTIHLNQILEKLNFPKMTIAGDRLRYQFDKELNVDG